MITKIIDSLEAKKERLENELADTYFFEDINNPAPKIEIHKSKKTLDPNEYESTPTITVEDLHEDEIKTLKQINDLAYKSIRSMTNVDRRKPKMVKGAAAQELEFHKCKYDILYFLENYCIVTAAGANIRLLLSDKLRIIARLYEASVPHIFMTSRQSAKTTIELVCIAWYFNFWGNTSTILINITQPDNKKNIKFIKDTIDNLPNYLRVWSPKENRSDVNNTQEIATPDSSNSKIGGVVINASSPGDTGRGKTGSPYWDEIAYLEGIKEAYAAVQFTYNTYSHFARMAGVPAPMSITSTPNDLGSEQGAFFNEIWNQGVELTNESYEEIKDKLPSEVYTMFTEIGSPFLKVFQRWYEFPGRIENAWLIDENNPDNIRYLLDDNNLTPDMVREYDAVGAEWLRRTYNTALNDKRTIKKDVFCEFFNSGEFAIFDEEIADELLSNRARPVRKLDITFDGDTLNKKATLFIYKDLDFNKVNVIISVDPAESAQGDNMAITVINDANGEVIADLFTKTGKIRAISDIMFKIHQLFPRAPVIVERNNFGKAVIERIEEKKEFRSLYSRLFYYYEINKSGNVNTDKKIYGINTNKENRDQMFTLLMEHVQANPELLNSPQIIRELIALEYRKGKIQASPGNTDDSVMALNLALYVREYKRRDLTRLFFDKGKIANSFRTIGIANEMGRYTMEELDTLLSANIGAEDIETNEKILGDFASTSNQAPINHIDFFSRFN